MHIIRTTSDAQADHCDHQDGKDNSDHDQCPDGDPLSVEVRVHDGRVQDREGSVEGFETIQEEE